MPKVFLDTNILVYSMDRADPTKQKKCREWVRSLIPDSSGVVSTQVLQDFYVASTSKLGADPLIIKDILRSFERFETVLVTPGLIREAVDCSIINQLSFWDSLIVVSAESAECEIVLTEDLNPGQIIRGVRIESPF